MFLFNIGLSRLINKLSLISNKNSLVPWAKMVKLSNEGSWLQNKRWSRIEASQFHSNSKHCIFHTEIYTQHKTQVSKIRTFKTENVRKIYLIFDNYLDFTIT